MKSLFRTMIVGLAVASLGASGAWAEEEMIDNPEYQHWTQFKVGTFSKIQIVTEMTQFKTQTAMTTTLKELTDEKAVIEIVTEMIVQDKVVKMPPQKRTIPARIAKPKPEPEGEKKKPKPETKKGEETVTVKAGKFKCKWVEVTTKKNDTTIVTKMWTCETVPGHLVKQTMTMEGEQAMTTTTELIETKTGEDKE